MRARACDRSEGVEDGRRHLAAVLGTAEAIGARREIECRRQMEAVEAIAACRLDATVGALGDEQAVLDSADPTRVLARGHALALDGADRPVTSARAGHAEPPPTLRFVDGVVAVRVVPA